LLIDLTLAVYDPFCGVGTVPFAALTLGVPGSGGELNPLSAFVARLAMDETRSKIEPINVARGIAWVDRAVKKACAGAYPDVKVTPSMAKERPDLAKYVGRTLPVEMYLWVRTVPDPNPAFSFVQVPLCTNFVTGAKAGRETWVEPVMAKTARAGRESYRFVVHAGTPPKGAENGTRQGKADFKSIIDGKLISSDYVKEMGRAGRMGVRMMAVFATGDDGEHVVLPVSEKVKVGGEGEQWTGNAFSEIPLPGNVRDVAPVGFGAKTYGDLFLPRQRATLETVGAAICEYARKGEKERAVAKVLTLAFSNFVSWHSTANTYWNQRQIPRNVFTRQAIHQTWDFVEANPLCSLKSWQRIAEATSEKFFALLKVGVGIVRQTDAQTGTPDEKCVVQTELPYYNNVAYADLADFFYGWVRPCLAAVEPDLADSVRSPREEELTAFGFQHGGQESANRFYREGVAAALRQIASYARTDYPAVFSFDFRSATFTGRDAEPLSAFVEGLVGAGFTITATWPLKDIRTKAVFGGEAGAGFRSLYFVCRPRRLEAETIGRRAFVEKLAVKLPQGLACYRALDRNLEEADYASAAVGVGLRFYSEYAQVLNPNGTLFSAGDALAEILRVVEEIRGRAREEGGAEGGAAGVRALPEKSVPHDCDACREIETLVRKGGEAAALRRKVVAAYEKAESEGRTEDAALWNDLLNRWYDLTEEII